MPTASQAKAIQARKATPSSTKQTALTAPSHRAIPPKYGTKTPPQSSIQSAPSIPSLAHVDRAAFQTTASPVTPRQRTKAVTSVHRLSATESSKAVEAIATKQVAPPVPILRRRHSSAQLTSTGGPSEFPLGDISTATPLDRELERRRKKSTEKSLHFSTDITEEKGTWLKSSKDSPFASASTLSIKHSARSRTSTHMSISLDRLRTPSIVSRQPSFAFAFDDLALITLQINTLTGKTFTLFSFIHDDIARVKEQISVDQDLPVTAFHLIHKDRALDQLDKTLNDYGIISDCKITLIPALHSGIGAPPARLRQQQQREESAAFFSALAGTSPNSCMILCEQGEELYLLEVQLRDKEGNPKTLMDAQGRPKTFFDLSHARGWDVDRISNALTVGGRELLLLLHEIERLEGQAFASEAIWGPEVTLPEGRPESACTVSSTRPVSNFTRELQSATLMSRPTSDRHRLGEVTRSRAVGSSREASARQVPSRASSGAKRLDSKEGPKNITLPPIDRKHCAKCKQKIPLTAQTLTCRCGQVFCTAHRMAEKHNCPDSRMAKVFLF